MCPSAFAPSFVQEGLIGAIHMRPKSQCVKVASSFLFSQLPIVDQLPRLDASAGGGNCEEAGNCMTRPGVCRSCPEPYEGQRQEGSSGVLATRTG
jgi:hypothetical protein